MNLSYDPGKKKLLGPPLLEPFSSKSVAFFRVLEQSAVAVFSYFELNNLERSLRKFYVSKSKHQLTIQQFK